jgi:hypothetical protein
LLGLCVRHLAMKCSSSSANGNSNKTILKKGGGTKKGTAGTHHSAAATTITILTSWEIECLLLAGKALLSRITDKIAKVRQAAIVACAPLLPLMTTTTSFSTATTTVAIQDTIQSILQKLLWIMSNDTSAANRATVVQVLPPLPSSTSVEQYDDDEEEENNDNNNNSSMLWLLQPIIERIKDVDGKVRESALDYLREKVTFGTQLTEDQRVEILRTGLTKR